LDPSYLAPIRQRSKDKLLDGCDAPNGWLSDGKINWGPFCEDRRAQASGAVVTVLAKSTY